MLTTDPGRWTFTASGATGTFNVNAPVFDTAALALYGVDAATSAIYTPTYSVALAADRSGAVISVTAGMTSGDKIIAYRVPKLTQLQSLNPSGAFPAKVTERQIDRAFADLQGIYEMVRRSARFPLADDTVAAELPVASLRASKVLGFDTQGALSVLAGVADVPVSAAWGPIVQAATVPAGLTLAGFSSYIQTLIDETTVAGLVAAIGALAMRNELGTDMRRRQTVLGGPVTAAGLPDFWPASAAGLTLTMQNVSATFPFMVSAAAGFNIMGERNVIGYSATNLAVVLANNTSGYIFAEVDPATHVITLVPIATLGPTYQEGGAYSTTNQQHTYNIAEAVMKVGDGAAAAQVYRVCIGEYTTSAGAITATVMYAYNGRYDSGYTATLPAAGVATSKNHNLGLLPLADFRIECTTADAGYAVGDSIRRADISGYNGAQSTVIAMGCTRNAVSMMTSGNPYQVLHKSTGAVTNLTTTSWKYKFTADRGW